MACLLLVGVLSFFVGSYIVLKSFTNGPPNVVEIYGYQLQGIGFPAAVGSVVCGLLAAVLAWRSLARRR